MKTDSGTQASDAQSPENTPNASLAYSLSAKSNISQNGDEVKHQRGYTVVDVQNGELMLQDASGKAVAASQAAFSDSQTQAMYLEIGKVADSPAAAQELLRHFDPNSQSAFVYGKGVAEAYLYGKNSFTMAEMLQRGSFVHDLTQQQQVKAFTQGQLYGKNGIFSNYKGKNAGVRPSVDAKALQRKAPAAYKALNNLGKALGVEIRITDMTENGRYENGHIEISSKLLREKGVSQAVATVFAHEITHRLQKTAPEAYAQYRKYVMEQLTDPEGTIREYQRAYGGKEKLSRIGAMDEIAADYTEQFLKDTELFQEFIGKGDKYRNIGQKLADAFREAIAKIKKFFAGESAKDAAQESLGAELSTAQKALQLWEEALRQGTEAVKNAPQREAAEGTVQYAVKQIGNTGMYYVQADRQVLSGTDPVEWAKQIESYINDVIRKEQDIAIPTIDGHILLLTGRSSYKLADRHIPSVAKKIEQFLSDNDFALKGRVATHIDELIEVARYDGYKPDILQKHENDIGEGGFNYYKANFMDFDGTYYEIPLSAGLNERQETVYSMGKPQKRSFPASHGSSSRKGGAQSSKEASTSIIYTSASKSQEAKTAVQLAFEKALKKEYGGQLSIPGTKDILQKDRERGATEADLRNMIALLKMQTAEGKEIKFLPSQVQKAAKSLLERANVSGSATELKAMLTEFYQKVARNRQIPTPEQIRQWARPAAKWLYENHQADFSSAAILP